MPLSNSTTRPPEQAKSDGGLIAAAPALAIILDLVRYGLMTLTDGDAEFDGVMYWFLNEPDWCMVLVNAIGWDTARSAIAEATTGQHGGRP